MPRRSLAERRGSRARRAAAQIDRLEPELRALSEQIGRLAQLAIAMGRELQRLRRWAAVGGEDDEE